jgi:hypothetical protein
MAWDRGKEAHLALRAIRNEMQKLVNCLDGAIAKYEQMERIEEGKQCPKCGAEGRFDYCLEGDCPMASRRPSPAGLDDLIRLTGSQLDDDGVRVRYVCHGCGQAGEVLLAGQSPQSE